jgi:hypothetical protein
MTLFHNRYALDDLPRLKEELRSLYASHSPMSQEIFEGERTLERLKKVHNVEHLSG